MRVEAQPTYVFLSKGRRLADVLAGVEKHLPGEALQAIVPQGYEASPDEERLAAHIVHTERAHYGLRDLWATARLVRHIRAQRPGRFIILFCSIQLRLLAALSGAGERFHYTMDGRLVPVNESPVDVLVDAVQCAIRGRITYARLWLAIRLRPIGEPAPPGRERSGRIS